jgi:predicted PurR-regulated permease PerM
MSAISVTPIQKRALGIAMAAALVIGAYFLKNYLMLIATAIIVAIVFNPIYQRLLKRFKKPKTAASLTLLITIIVIIIPLALVIFMASFQVTSIIDTIKNSGQNTDLNQILDSMNKAINDFFKSLGLSFQVEQSAFRDQLVNALKAIGQNIFDTVTSWVSGIGSLISTLIIYIYVFISILVNQDKLLEFFKKINPLGDQVSNIYIDRADAMTKAMVRGQFIIAFFQGLTDALLLYIAGFHSTFYFYLILLIILSIIPLGGGIIVLPIGVIMILLGDYWQGALLILGHLLIVTNIDNVLRPRLVPASARLDPALVLLSVFSGLAFFGFIGIILGPVLMILIVTTIQVYLEVFRQTRMPKTLDTKSKPKRYQKLMFWKHA